MIEVIVNNVYTEVLGMNKDQELTLWETLAFEVKEFQTNFEHGPKIRHLYNRKTKLTYTGLLPYVEDLLKSKSWDYIVTDKRVKPDKNANFSLVTTIGGSPFQLRDYQQKIVNECDDRAVIQCATGGGKAIFSSTCLLTPTGWKMIKDIHIGDTIYDENGKKTKVIGEYPQGVKDVYEVKFKDGTSIHCCKDHLWKYTTRATRFDVHKYKVEPLKQMLQYKLNGARNVYKMAIPVNKPIEFDKKELFIHPYVLGLLLGDGGLAQKYAITFSNPEKDIVNRLKELTKQHGEWHLAKNSNIEYQFTNLQNQQPGTNQFRKYIKNIFKRCHSTDKFIPKEYLYSSIEDRLELVRGLIDTDGNVNHKGHVSFCTVSKQLRDDFIFLVRSLGYRVSIKSIDRRKEHEAYDIYIWGCDDTLFSSEKHKKKFAARLQPNKKHRYDILKIVDIKKLDYQEEMKCIAVDSPDHTYICEDFIVTHNTVMLAALIPKFNVKPVSIIADKLSLCMQLRNEIGKFLGEDVGLIGGGVNEKRDITVYSAQSVTEDLVKDTKLLMVDECHHTPANTISDIARWCKDAYYRIGVSATPWRDDGADLLIDAAFWKQKEDCRINASYLIERKYLVPCTIYWVPVKMEFQGKNYNKLYSDAIVHNYARNMKIVTIACKMLQYKNATTLILIRIVEHAEILYRLFEMYIPIKSFSVNVKNLKTGKQQLVRVKNIEILTGKDDAVKREAVLQAAREKKVEILIASTIADEGLDCPAISDVILAGAGKSSTRAFQRIGRALRLFTDPNTGEEKTCARIFDFQDYTKMFRRHARVRDKLYHTEPAWDIKVFPEALFNTELNKINKEED